jgi:hypothetical protein
MPMSALYCRHSRVDVGRSEPARANGRQRSMESCDTRLVRVPILTTAAVLILTACGTGSHNSDRASAGEQTRSPIATHTSQPISRDDLVGTWMPISLWGRAVHGVHGQGSPGAVSFHKNPQRGWTGYDGCNWTGGRFHVGEAGSFTTNDTRTTTRACVAIVQPATPLRASASVTVLTRASRVAIENGRLVLFGPTGHAFGVYVRAS